MPVLEAKYKGVMTWIHYVDDDKTYALVCDDSYSGRGLFKVDMKDIEVDEKKLEAYLLVKVEKRR